MTFNHVFKSFVLATIVLGFQTSMAQEYVLFEPENETANDTFGWDFFSGDYAGPHNSTLGSAEGTLTVSPGGFVSSSMNLYAFMTFPEYNFSISNLETTQPFHNVVIQIATSDAEVTELDFTPAPSEFIYMGAPSNIGDFPIHFYWVEWTGLDATESFAVELLGFIEHVTFAGARISYYNTPEPLDITFGDIQIVMGDVNCDGIVSLLDIAPFVELITSGNYLDKADMNQDGAVNLLDVEGFVAILTG